MKIVQKVIILFLIIFVISLYILINEFVEYKVSNDSNIELIENVITNKGNEEKMDIQWEKIKNINQDIIGWIKIEDTNINYPILKDNNSLKYLKYTHDGKYNKNGSIFTLDEDPFNERITTIHGHNMKNGLMFSELSKYMSEKFLKEHSTFYIYTEKQNYKATIFSCYSINVNTEENNIKWLDSDGEIDYYKNISKYSVEDIGQIDKIVKLSTCSYFDNTTSPTSQRYFIVAKLENEEKTAESIDI